MKARPSNERTAPASLLHLPAGQEAGPVEAIWKESLDDPKETHAFARLVRRAVEYIEPRRVLDVGCGSGVPTIEAAYAAAPRVLGIDPSARNVSRARHNIRAAGLESVVTAHRACWRDVLQGDFQPGHVDLVVSNPPYLPAGEGSAVDGGSKGTRLLLSIIDGLPPRGRGVALLLGSLSDPLHVVARIGQRGYRVTHLFAESVPFGRYTSVPKTLAALERLRLGGSAWFFDTHGDDESPVDSSAAPHAYLRIGLIAERRAGRAQTSLRSCPSRRVPAGTDGREAHRTVARLLETYQHGGPGALAEFLLRDAPEQTVEPL